MDNFERLSTSLVARFDNLLDHAYKRYCGEILPAMKASDTVEAIRSRALARIAHDIVTVLTQNLMLTDYVLEELNSTYWKQNDNM